MFTLEKVLPNGGLGQYHKVVKMELHVEGIHAVVNSYHLPEMQMITWQDTYLIPPPFSAENLAQVEALLVLPGAPFEGGSVIPDETATLEQAQARKWGEIKAYRFHLEQTGVAPTPFGDVQCDDASKIKINGLVMMAQLAGASFSQTFTLADNTSVALDAAEMTQLGVAVGMHVAQLHAQAQAVRALINAATTIEDVEAITWDSV